MKDKDQELLWEAYLTEGKSDNQEVGEDGFPVSPNKQQKKFIKNSRKWAKKQNHDEKKEEEGDDDKPVEENVGGAQLPEDLIYTALETAGSDWESAVRLIGQAIGEHIINDVKYSGAGPLTDKDMAESWSYREGVKVAMDDLFAQGISDNIDDVFKAAFHSASDEQYSALDMLGYEPEDYEHDDIDQAAMDRMGAEQEL